VDRPRIALLTLGGTIAMAGGQRGVVARLGGADVLGDADGGYDVDVHDFTPVGSSNLTFAGILDAVDRAVSAVSAGVTGIVLTQGTDTLEETAFLIDSVWAADEPFVVTGAMRNPTLPGADGPANVAAALRVAADPAARGRGTLVVFNDEIHAPRYVRKTHTSSVATFRSADTGPIGYVVEGVPRFLTSLPRRVPVTGIDRTALATTRVAFHTALLDDDASALGHLGAETSGLVIAAFGVGHMPATLVPVLGDLAARMPVVLTSRTGSGSVFAATYGAVGGERDLLERGLINGGYVHPYKARVLLRLLLAAGASRDGIVAAFTAYSSG
jgi:L-asparaginase